MKKKILFFSLIFFSTLLYAQNVIYVATNGSDETGNGTFESPYASVQFALNQANDNDTIILRGGTYQSNEIRIDRNNITIKSFDGEWAVIQASTDDEDITSCIWFHEPTIVGGRLERLEIIGGYFYGIKLESDWDWGNPIPDRHGVSNIVISHCKIHDTGRDCIKMASGCDSIIVESCTIFNSGVGIGNDPNDPNAEGIDMVNNDDVIIRNNYVYNTSTSGIYSKGGSINVIIENNLVMNTGENGILLGFYTDEDWFDTIANPNFYENINGIVRNNIIINTRYDGIGMYAADHPKVYNNTVVDAAQNEHAALFFNTGYIWIDEISDMIAPPTKDVFVVNNIFVVSDTSSHPNAQIRYYESDTNTNMLGNCIVDYNLYYKSGGAEFDDGIDWQILSFEQWKNSTGFDAHSIEADPLLDDNFHLMQGSPCIDAATNAENLIFDYDGNHRSLPFDIGADEYGAGDNLQVPPDTNSLGTGNDSVLVSKILQFSAQSKVDIFPNPAHNFLRINSFENQINSIEIFNISGQKIKENFITNQYKMWIDVSDFKTGLYIVKICLKNQVVYKKIIVKH
jgi:hypothetical protein